MIIRLDEQKGDVGILVIGLEVDDSLELTVDADRLVTLSLPLYAGEARRLREAIHPLAEVRL